MYIIKKIAKKECNGINHSKEYVLYEILAVSFNNQSVNIDYNARNDFHRLNVNFHLFVKNLCEYTLFCTSFCVETFYVGFVA